MDGEMGVDRGITFREMFGDDAYYREKFRERTMPCRYCGTVMQMGSGERPTDFHCPKCDEYFNSAGTRIMSEYDSRRRDPCGDGYDYCGNDYDYEPEPED